MIWLINRSDLSFISLQSAQDTLSQSVTGLTQQVGALGSAVGGAIRTAAYRSGESALATLHNCHDSITHQYGRLKYAAEQAASTSAAVIVGQFIHQGICVGVPTLMRDALAYQISKALDERPIAAYITLASSMILSNLLLIHSRYRLRNEWSAFELTGTQSDITTHRNVAVGLAEARLSPELQNSIRDQVTAAHKRVKDFDRMLLAQNSIYLVTLATIIVSHGYLGSTTALESAAALGGRNAFYCFTREAFQSTLQVSGFSPGNTNFDLNKYPDKNIATYSLAITATGTISDKFFPINNTMKNYQIRALLNTLPEWIDDCLMRLNERKQNPGSSLKLAPSLHLRRLIGKHPNSEIDPNRFLSEYINVGERLINQPGSRNFFFTLGGFVATSASRAFEMAFPVSKTAGKNTSTVGNILKRWISEPQGTADINKKHLLFSIMLSNLAFSAILPAGFYRMIVGNWLSDAASRSVKVKYHQAKAALNQSNNSTNQSFRLSPPVSSESPSLSRSSSDSSLPTQQPENQEPIEILVVR